MVANKQNVLVILPAYNEEKSIGAVIREVQQSIPEADIVVVDDGSVDGTVRVVRKTGAKLISHPTNLGAGAATQTGYMYALRHSYQFVVQLDADGQHNPQHIRALLRILQDDLADVAIGSRFLEKRGYQPSWIKNLGMRVLGLIASLVMGQRLTDSTSGFRALKREVVDFFANIDYPSDYQDADVIILAHSANFRIREVPVTMHQRLSGKSMHRGYRLIYYGFKMLLSVVVTLLRQKPLKERRK